MSVGRDKLMSAQGAEPGAGAPGYHAECRLCGWMLTLHQYPAEKNAAYQAGADDYLGKPLHPATSSTAPTPCSPATTHPSSHDPGVASA